MWSAVPCGPTRGRIKMLPRPPAKSRSVRSSRGAHREPGDAPYRTAFKPAGLSGASAEPSAGRLRRGMLGSRDVHDPACGIRNPARGRRTIAMPLLRAREQAPRREWDWTSKNGKKAGGRSMRRTRYQDEIVTALSSCEEKRNRRGRRAAGVRAHLPRVGGRGVRRRPLVVHAVHREGHELPDRRVLRRPRGTGRG